VLENAPLAQQTWASMQPVLRPKMDGAWNLHTLTRSSRLQYFVLFSSWASIDGSQGQANHVAANFFLDGLAQLRRGQGLPGLSINWGAWAETGAAAGDAVQRQLARVGLETMPPTQALETMLLALGMAEAQIGIAAIRWPRYLEQRGSAGSRSFYASIMSGEDLLRGDPRLRAGAQGAGSASDGVRGDASQIPAGERSLRGQILAQAPAARSAAITRAVSDAVRHVLRLAAGEAIDPDLPISDLGMDSLLAIELRNVLSGLFECQCPSTLLFDHPTVRALTAYLGKEMKSPEPSPGPAPDLASGLAPGQASGRSAAVLELQLPSQHHTESKVSAVGGRDSILDFLDSIESMSDQDVESFDFRS
jgi:acyl carrier protein